MFIYQQNGAICITFKDNKPVDGPEYIITIDEKNRTVRVNGKEFVDTIEEPVVSSASKTVSTKKTTKVKEPVIEPETPVEPEVIEEEPKEVVEE